MLLYKIQLLLVLLLKFITPYTCYSIKSFSVIFTDWFIFLHTNHPVYYINSNTLLNGFINVHMALYMMYEIICITAHEQSTYQRVWVWCTSIIKLALILFWTSLILTYGIPNRTIALKGDFKLKSERYSLSLFLIWTTYTLS